MNQILLTDNENIKKKASGKYNTNNSSGDMKKIIMFFSVFILIFAIAIIGLYTYKISNKEEKRPVEKPLLSLEQTENNVKIIAKAEAGINKIIYKWNNEELIEKEMNGRTSHEEELVIPEGQNILKIAIIDLNNEKIETEKEFYIEEIEKPTIQLDETIGNGKVKITVTDENNFIKYITYKWNEEEEITVSAEEENQKVLETTIDVKRGRNKLIITAVNGAFKTEIIEKTFDGVNNPEIDVKREGNIIYMKITHDMGLKSVVFNVNGKEYAYDKNYSGYDSELKEIEYKYNLIEGENTIIIHAVSNEITETTEGIKNTESTYKGKSEYTAE